MNEADKVLCTYGNPMATLLSQAVLHPLARFANGFLERLGWLVQVNSNYGRPDYTCVYRVRVHGIAPGHAEEIMTEEVSSPAGSATSGSF